MNPPKSILSLAALTFLSCPRTASFQYPTETLPYFYKKNNLAIVEGDLHPFTLKSQKEGEAEIEQLVQTAEIEEAWLYLEEQESKQGIWLDIGEIQTAHKVFSKAETKEVILETIDNILQGKTIFATFYHIHPKASYQDLSPKEETVLVSQQVEALSIPSVMDTDQYLNYLSLLNKKSKNNHFIMQPSVVITPWVKFTYTVSSVYLEKCRNQKTLSYCNWHSERSSLKIFLYDPILNYHKKISEKTCENLPCALETLASVGIDIEYTRRSIPDPFFLNQK